jgi:hypothetical protein
VRWDHARGPAHCLARLYLRPSASPVAIVSELRSNPWRRGITGNFAAVAEACLNGWGELVELDPASIVWVAHHGGFSFFDAPDQPTTFTRVDLVWDGNRYHDSVHRHHLLSPAAAAELTAGLVLEPVPQVVAAIQ